jgi:tRNA(Ile)-lysidine synthase
LPKALVNSVADALRAAGVQPGSRVVVAVSGGVDSMVLLHALARSPLRLALRVAHIHHGLRGRSADRDAAMVAAAAERCGLPVSVVRLTAATRPRATSVQVWARDARYAALEAIRKRVRAAWVLTAHTENDQAETVLLNLLRGTGVRGLAGIPRVRDRILRPLLDVSRSLIAAYADRHQVAFRDDPSNRSVAYRRNRIRHRLLPLLAQEYNPRIVETLAGLATHAREDDDALTLDAMVRAQEAICARGGTVGVRRAVLRVVPKGVARRLLLLAFGRVAVPARGLTRRHLAALLCAAERGGHVALPGDVRAWVSATCLWFGPVTVSQRISGIGRRAAPPRIVPTVSLRLGEWTGWDRKRCFVRVRRVSGAEARMDRGDPSREIMSAALLTGSLTLRAWRPGDRFRPLGLPGAKKLQDFFVDAKVPCDERRRVPLLMAGDRIAWVVGHRIADEFRWRGEPVACLAEVKFPEGAHGISVRSHPAAGR